MTLEVEIGCGRGKFIVARAQANPNIRFLGIDKAHRFMRRGVERSRHKRLANLEFIKGDFRQVVADETSANSVAVFHVYFPDPWPKRRQRKRRLLNEALFVLLYNRLRGGGKIEIATDDADYFSAIKRCIAATPLSWEEMRESVNQRLFAPEFKTNYEMKYETAGRPLYYLELCKPRGVPFFAEDRNRIEMQM